MVDDASTIIHQIATDFGRPAARLRRQPLGRPPRATPVPPPPPARCSSSSRDSRSRPTPSPTPFDSYGSTRNALWCKASMTRRPLIADSRVESTGALRTLLATAEPGRVHRDPLCPHRDPPSRIQPSGRLRRDFRATRTSSSAAPLPRDHRIWTSQRLPASTTLRSGPTYRARAPRQPIRSPAGPPLPRPPPTRRAGCARRRAASRSTWRRSPAC